MNALPTRPSFSPHRDAARPHLVGHALERFRRLAACMFAGRHAPLREVTARLTRRLEAIYSFEVRDFAGSAAGHVRAALIESVQAADAEPAPDELLEWVRVHQGVETLPEDERELFDLLLYWGMREAEVAALLGVSARRVRMRWCECRLALDHAMRRGRAGGQ